MIKIVYKTYENKVKAASFAGAYFFYNSTGAEQEVGNPSVLTNPTLTVIYQDKSAKDFSFTGKIETYFTIIN